MTSRTVATALVVLSLTPSFFLRAAHGASPVGASRAVYFLAAIPIPFKMMPARMIEGKLWRPKFPTAIYRSGAEGRSLVPVRVVVPADVGTDFVRYYYDERLIVVGHNEHAFSLLPMDRPREARSVPVTFDEFGSVPSAHLLDIPGRGLVQAFDLFVYDEGRRERRTLIGLDIGAFKQMELSWDQYKHLLISGIAGVGGGTDTVGVLVDEDGAFRLFLSGRDEPIRTDWPSPDAKTFRRGPPAACYINNKSVLVLGSSAERNMEGEDGRTTACHVYAKQKQEWTRKVFRGSHTYLRAFGPWLAGFVAYDEREKVSPGRAHRPAVRTDLGMSFDEQVKKMGIYLPGELFLYNAATGEEHHIHTGEGDSEVLLVEDRKVIYRVNQRIWEAPLGKHRTEARLVAEGEAVRNVHWAFTSGP